MDHGMMIQPTKNLRLDLYADADFARLWGAEDKDDPTCVKSWTGNLLTLGDVPIIWMSKLQMEIALSTAKSKYISLSTSMWTLLPLWSLLEEICGFLNLKQDSLSKVSAVWEDNQAALKLATAQFPNMSPRTKHIVCKYHWFWLHLQPGAIKAKYVTTKEQKANIFTKGLVPVEFELQCKMIMGW